MDLKLANKVALVCASSAGIGKGIARVLAEEGADVALLGRDADKLAVAEKEVRRIAKGRVFATTCDLSDVASIATMHDAVVRNLGAVDILVNNQGGPAPGALESLSDEQVDLGVKTNLTGVLFLTKLCLPAMRNKQWGRVINVLSLSAKEPLGVTMMLSNILRPAVLGFSKTLAVELAPTGVTVNSVLPAAVMSQRTTDLLTIRADKEGRTLDEVVADAAKNIPIGHIASPTEFAQIVAFLASEQASYITGTAISVDGGMSKSLY